MKATKTLKYNFSDKHIDYMQKVTENTYNVAEGAVRAGKTVDNVLAFALMLDKHPDKFHLASGSTVANAKLNIGVCNGLGLENIFRGRHRWGKYKENEALYVQTPVGERIIIFSGGELSNSFSKIRGNSYGMWIATEIDNHHKVFIDEARRRLLASRDRKVLWDLNPKNPNNWIYRDYIDSMADKYAKGKFSAGYNYERFTIYDNVNLSKQTIKEVEEEYPEGTVDRIRYVEGNRIAAEGLIYKAFADNSQDYFISYKEAKKKRYQFIHIGVDIGGTESKHAFVCSGYTLDRQLIVLRSERLETNLDPDQLSDKFIDFAKKCYKDFNVQLLYFESAEQVLKKGFETKIKSNRLPLRVRNSVKGKVIDRIRAVNTLIAQERFLYTEHSTTVKEALSEAMWCPKAAEKGIDERLDDGTTDIDTLDGFEYSFSSEIRKLVR